MSRVRYDDPERSIESDDDIIAAIAPAVTSAANQTGVYDASNSGRTLPPSGTVTPRPFAQAPSMNAGTNSKTTRTGHSEKVRLRTRLERATKKRWLICGNIATPKAMFTALETTNAGEYGAPGAAAPPRAL